MKAAGIQQLVLLWFISFLIKTIEVGAIREVIPIISVALVSCCLLHQVNKIRIFAPGCEMYVVSM